jgi:hypothetical protein
MHYDQARKPDFRGHAPVPVCVATLFQWNYASPGEPPQLGKAGIIATDRMITAGDVKYEPNRLKIGEMNSRTLVSVAGDYSVHSQAIHDARKLLGGSRGNSPENVARMYGKAIQESNNDKPKIFTWGRLD